MKEDMLGCLKKNNFRKKARWKSKLKSLIIQEKVLINYQGG